MIRVIFGSSESWILSKACRSHSVKRGCLGVRSETAIVDRVANFPCEKKQCRREMGVGALQTGRDGICQARDCTLSDLCSDSSRVESKLEKMSNCSQYTVGRGINRRFSCPEKKIQMVFLIPQFCRIVLNRKSINAQNFDINGRSLRGFIMIRARFQNIHWVLFSLLCGYYFLLFKTIPNYSKK